MVMILFVIVMLTHLGFVSAIKDQSDLADTTDFEYNSTVQAYLQNNKILNFENELPTLVLHGLYGFCHTPNATHVVQIYDAFIAYNHFHGKKLYVECVNQLPGDDPAIEGLAATFLDLTTQVRNYCTRIKEHEVFGKGDFNVIGLSQGGLIARSLITQCEMSSKVHNFASIGVPNNGIQTIPGCDEPFWCDIVRAAANLAAYSLPLQLTYSPAGFYRLTDSFDYEFYKAFNWFLPKLNNEVDHPDMFMQKYKFQSLNRLLLVESDNDTSVTPYRSAQFGELRDGKVLTVFETEAYQQDRLGLKTMNEIGKVSWLTLKGRHIEYRFGSLGLFIDALYNKDYTPFSFGTTKDLHGN